MSEQDAIELKGHIQRLAADRSRAWRTGDLVIANRRTVELAETWQLWRQARAEADSEHKPYDPANGTRNVRRADEPVARFLAATCVLDADFVTPVGQLRDAYNAWAIRESEEPVSSTKLTLELRKHGIESTRTKAVRLYRGVRVTGWAEMPSSVSKWAA